MKSVELPKPEDMPIYTHTFVLGADIGVAQQANMQEMLHGTHHGGLYGVDIDAMGSRSYIHQRSRQYLAAWARRNLFDGQPSTD